MVGQGCSCTIYKNKRYSSNFHRSNVHRCILNARTVYLVAEKKEKACK